MGCGGVGEDDESVAAFVAVGISVEGGVEKALAVEGLVDVTHKVDEEGEVLGLFRRREVRVVEPIDQLVKAENGVIVGLKGSTWDSSAA